MVGNANFILADYSKQWVTRGGWWCAKSATTWWMVLRYLPHYLVDEACREHVLTKLQPAGPANALTPPTLGLCCGGCLFKSLFGFQRILKDLYRRLSRAQLIRTLLVTGDFRVNILHAEKLIIGQSQQGLQFFNRQMDRYFRHV
jgi:hypothetical protein